MKNKFGIIGNPVHHSLSPVMFQAAFEALHIAATYEPFELASNDLKSFFKKMRRGALSGINVTIPYKQKVIEYLDTLTPDAQRVGAVNTIYLENKKLIGANTDGVGYLNALTEETGMTPQNFHVCVIGAGGASLAVCDALCQQNILSLTLVNRSPEKAESLLSKLKLNYPHIAFSTVTLTQLHTTALSNTDLCINTTAMGMTGIEWPCLDFLTTLRKPALVSDIVYTPLFTPLLQKAKELGLTIIPGTGMLVHQAVAAFELFLKQKPDFQIMKQVLIKALEEKT